MTPGEATMRAAAAYERGLKPVTHLIDVADEQTAMRLRAAADPAGKDRLAAGSLDDHATDRRMRCSHVPCCWRNVDGIRLATWMS